MEVERHESADASWEIARRLPSAPLRGLVGRALEGWRRDGPPTPPLRELPVPGVPLILELGDGWTIEEVGVRPERLDSFLAGLHTRPTIVSGSGSFACVELMLTPLGTRRLLGLPMHELAGRTVALEDLLPGAAELAERVREAGGWAARFDLVEDFLVRRLADTPESPRELDWAWRRLVRSGGREPVGRIAAELQWSPGRLIDRFREHVGLAPKAAARVIRFDRAVAALGSGVPRIAEVAAQCGYADQAHLNREFRELAGQTPGELLAARA